MSMIKFRGYEAEVSGAISDFAIPAPLVTGLCRVVEKTGDFPFEPKTVLLSVTISSTEYVYIVQHPSFDEMVELLEQIWSAP